MLLQIIAGFLGGIGLTAAFLAFIKDFGGTRPQRPQLFKERLFHRIYRNPNKRNRIVTIHGRPIDFTPTGVSKNIRQKKDYNTAQSVRMLTAVRT